jgi:hypothetical protein
VILTTSIINESLSGLKPPAAKRGFPARLPRTGLSEFYRVLATDLLGKLTRHKGHDFWPDEYSIVDGTVDLKRLVGHKQIADLYLLGLAVRRKGKFSSLDRHLPANLVTGGAEA